MTETSRYVPQELGVDIDLDQAWDERKEYWKIAGHIVKTTNITQTAVGKNGLWTTVVAAAEGHLVFG